jgi:hypothetical protein
MQPPTLCVEPGTQSVPPGIPTQSVGTSKKSVQSRLICHPRSIALHLHHQPVLDGIERSLCTIIHT